LLAILKNQNYLRYVLIACAIAVVSSWTNFGHLCGDEYSQIFEFAAWKLGRVDHADLRLWEFDSQMRPSIQIWMVVGMYKLAGLFTNEVNPFAINYIIYLASGILSIASILVFTNAFIHRVKENYRNYFVLLSLFTWLVLYSNTHFNSENICGHLLLLAVGLFYGNLQKSGRFLPIIAAGILLGLSFSCRFQVGFSILGLITWFFITSWKRKTFVPWILLSASLLLSISIFTIIADYFFYGRFVLSPYNYYYQNVATGTMNRASGVSPWFAYLFMVSIYLPFGPLYALATIRQAIRFPLDILTSIITPFVLFHCLIGHKEIRFLLPMLGFMPILMMGTLDELVTRFRYFEKYLPLIIRVFWTVNVIACFSMLIPAATEIGAWRYLYSHYSKPTLLYYEGSIHQKLLYYRRPNLIIIVCKEGDPTPCPSGFNVLLAIDAKSKRPKTDLPLAYTFFPFGLDKILPPAINRSVGHFDIYELKNIESQ
jgi:phosphatidylinositol glycan class B